MMQIGCSFVHSKTNQEDTTRAQYVFSADFIVIATAELCKVDSMAQWSVHVRVLGLFNLR